MEPIDVETASNDELNRWLKEHVLKIPKAITVDRGYKFVSVLFPCTNRDDADMCLSKFWDRWEIQLYRNIAGHWYGEASGEFGVVETEKCNTEARCRAELAALIALEESRADTP